MQHTSLLVKIVLHVVLNEHVCYFICCETRHDYHTVPLRHQALLYGMLVPEHAMQRNEMRLAFITLK